MFPHFGGEADKVQRPRQILLKVSTLGLATEKYIQIAVVLVSTNCSPDHGECAKMCFPSILKPQKCPNCQGCHFVVVKCWGVLLKP